MGRRQGRWNWGIAWVMSEAVGTLEGGWKEDWQQEGGREII